MSWIKVSEELPPMWTEVLVYPRPNDYCCEAQVDAGGVWHYGEYERGFGHNVAVCKVTHWMPFPAAPTQQVDAQASLQQRSQHDADSREHDLLQVDVAALEASVGNLGRLVDQLRLGHDRYEYLRERPVNAISVGTGGVFAGLVPDNVVLNGPELDAAIDAALAASTKGDAS